MKETLVQISQQRAYRCKTEQFWAVALVNGLNGLLIVESKNILKDQEHFWLVFSGMLLIGLLIYVFILIREKNYYEYRNDIARLLKDSQEAKAIKYITKEKEWINRKSLLWFISFFLVVFLPIFSLLIISPCG